MATPRNLLAGIFDRAASIGPERPLWADTSEIRHKLPVALRGMMDTVINKIDMRAVYKRMLWSILNSLTDDDVVWVLYGTRPD